MKTPLLLLASLIPTLLAAAELRVERVPENGLQPDALTDSTGRVHLIYLTGDPKSSDIHYVSRRAPSEPWSQPVRVNSQPGSAVAIGTVRGARLSLASSNRVCVVWNGSSQATAGSAGSAPLLFSRQTDDHSGFEPQRNLMGSLRHLDGGGSVTANEHGGVVVAWHAAPATPGADHDGEAARGIYLAVSQDDGRTFSDPRRIDSPPRGVCACCALEAGFAGPNEIRILYRGAEGLSERGLVELLSADGAKTFASRRIDQWSLNQCPMTTTRLAPGADFAVWSTRGRIWASPLGGSSPSVPNPVSPESRQANHPTVARSPDGRTLVAWTEGTGWQRGGGLAWSERAQRSPTWSPVQRRPGVPVWGSPAAVCESDGHFTVWY
jgi:hypothetical protein